METEKVTFIVITKSATYLSLFLSPFYHFLIYIFLLKSVRAIRDDHMCSEKYGDDWIEYKKRVPYMFIPYVF